MTEYILIGNYVQKDLEEIPENELISIYKKWWETSDDGALRTIEKWKSETEWNNSTLDK